MYSFQGHIFSWAYTAYPKKYAHGFCFVVLCRGYTLTDFPISIRLTSLALWQSNDCPSASKATLMNMDKYFMWIHYERLHNHNKAKHNKTVCIFLGIYCTSVFIIILDKWIPSPKIITRLLGSDTSNDIKQFTFFSIHNKTTTNLELKKYGYHLMTHISMALPYKTAVSPLNQQWG